MSDKPPLLEWPYPPLPDDAPGVVTPRYALYDKDSVLRMETDSLAHAVMYCSSGVLGIVQMRDREKASKRANQYVTITPVTKCLNCGRWDCKGSCVDFDVPVIVLKGDE